MITVHDPPEGKKTAVVLLSGFLGSGKTTLLKHILSWEADLSETVVIVNEFGKVGIDGALLKETGSDVVELASGCICCTLQIDLQHTLKKVGQRFHPRQILIEASGIADPSTIASVLNDADLAKHLELKKIVTVLDSECWRAREAFGTVFYNQLKLADLILLNKIDLLDKDEIQRYLEEIHDTIPHCRVVPTVHCRIDPEAIRLNASRKSSKLKLAHFAGINTVGPDEVTADGHQYTAFSFEDQRAVDETDFKRFIEDLPWELFRLKGSVRFPDRTELINFVGGKWTWEDWRGAPETRLTFIGWEVDENDIITRLKNCIVENNPASG